MPKAEMKGMVMRGVVACLPEREVHNDRDYPWFGPSEIRKVTAMVGVKSHRMADPSTCTSDLCLVAARRLLSGLNWEPSTVDGLILISQTFDYVMPSSSCLLQAQLGLPESCACFDVALGCSAYVYGLWMANALLSSRACNRILVLAGDTPSKFVDPKDRATALLFGDAGTATALEFSEGPEWKAHHILYTDGKGATDLIIGGGGFRNRFPDDRSLCYVTMDGGHIFDFTRNRVPALIEEMFTFSRKTAVGFDYFVFHQANEYLIKFMANKAGVDMNKVPLCIGKFGNTAAASVALTLATAGPPQGTESFFQVMFLGYGVGLSWGAVSMCIPRDCLLQNCEYRNCSVEAS